MRKETALSIVELTFQIFSDNAMMKFEEAYNKAKRIMMD